jgi:hypothetical protein
MTSLSKKFEQIIKKELASTVLPIKTEEGILLGDVLITSDGTSKNIVKKGILVYEHIFLNSVAIKIAKLLLLSETSYQADNLYRLDQEYGKWLNESLLLRAQYDRALTKGENDRADVFYAKYIESKERTISAKSRADFLAR